MAKTLDELVTFMREHGVKSIQAAHSAPGITGFAGCGPSLATDIPISSLELVYATGEFPGIEQWHPEVGQPPDEPKDPNLCQAPGCNEEGGHPWDTRYCAKHMREAAGVR